MTLSAPHTDLNVRCIGSDVAEFYLTARPVGSGISAVAEMYRDIARVLRGHGASIVQERLFATASAQPAALAARARSVSHPVLPTVLTARGNSPEVVGVQVHAIAGAELTLLSGGCRFTHAGRNYLSLSGVKAPKRSSPGEEARHVFATAAAALRDAGAGWHDVARTWLWMDNILDWYPELNRLRSSFFKQQGLFDRPSGMPASTGIGVAPATGHLAMDLFAAWGQDDVVRRFHATGNQRSANEYGSAFARAAVVHTPGGDTVYCSGTAAIDTAGRTCHHGDILGQVQMTVANVDAVLRDMGCTGDDVVQAMAYCATPAVERHFVDRFADQLPWPCLILEGDVCRHDLLFEIEVTALRSSRSPSSIG